MMPLAAALLRTLGGGPLRCDAEGMAGDDHPLDEQSRSGVRAGVFSERTTKFAADMRLGPPMTARPGATSTAVRSRWWARRDCMNGIINQEGIA